MRPEGNHLPARASIWNSLNAAAGGGPLDTIDILIVDDEHLVHSFISGALSEAGFAPFGVSSGDEALSLLRDSGDKYRALVTDVNLGANTMDGWQLARRVREMHPDFPIVYMTGASAEQWTANGVPNSILLTKPFAPAQLVTAVSQLLNVGTSPLCPKDLP